MDGDGQGGDFLSSDGEDKDDYEGYDTVEEMVLNTERDHDNEVRKTMRFRRWQEAQLKLTKNQLGTNMAEIIPRAYLLGLKRMREGFGEEIGELNDMITEFIMVVGSTSSSAEETDHIYNDVFGHEAGIEENATSELTEARRYPVRDSALSEVENTFVDDAFFGPWVHRYVVMMGMLESKYLMEDVEARLSSFQSSVNDTIQETRQKMEQSVKRYLQERLSFWMMNGVTQKTLDDWHELVSMMQTEKKEVCKEILVMAENQYKTEADTE